MSKISFKILTPTKSIFDEQVDKIVLQSETGELGILPDHVDLIIKTIPGELKVTISGKESHFALGDGLLAVANNNVVLLTDLAETSAEINEKAVLEAKKRAEEALEDKLSVEEYATTMAIIQKSLVQLRVKRRHHERA